MSKNMLSDKDPYRWWPDNETWKSLKPEDLTPEARKFMEVLSDAADEAVTNKRKRLAGKTAS